ncbi:MAG TPA: hypothetical protein VMW38_21395 [Terriglobia bacterium]|nr:hypothetical protein [Terriglobia bacterium]
MPKSLSHVSRTREYPGEELAAPLLGFLNQRRPPEDRKQVERLLENLQTLRMIVGERRYRKGEWGDSWGGRKSKFVGLTWFAKDPFLGKKFKTALRAVRKELSRHRMWPDLEMITSPRSSSSGSSIDFRWDTGGSRVSEAVLQIVLLGREGLLWRIRRCPECGRWFFAKFRHQEYWPPACQIRHYKTSPEWREKRRKYMQLRRRKGLF